MEGTDWSAEIHGLSLRFLAPAPWAFFLAAAWEAVVQSRCPKCGEAVDLGGLSVGICDCGAKVRLPERPPRLPTSGQGRRKEPPVASQPEEISSGELASARVAGESTPSEWTGAAVGEVGRGVAGGCATLVLGLMSVIFCLACIAEIGSHGSHSPQRLEVRSIQPALWVIAALLCWILISLGWLRDAITQAKRDR